MADNATPVSQPVNTLEIRNYKSLKNVNINPSRVNIFFGRPNSGKSNLLEALTLFNILQNKDKRKSEATLIRYNNLDNLFYDRDVDNDITVNYDGNLAYFCYYPAANTYIQAVNPVPDFVKNKKIFSDQGLSINDIASRGPILGKSEGPLKYTPLFALLDQDGNSASQTFGTGPKENPVRKYEFKEGVDYSDPFRNYLKTFGENLFTIVETNAEIKEWITPFFEDFDLEFLIDFSSKKFEIQKKQKGIVYKIPFELTPDTFRRMLFYIAAIYSNRNTTILLEEPEAHSFPPFVKELSELIKADNHNTYFITTHSPYFINSLIEDSENIKDISFFHVFYKDYQTQIKQLDQKELDTLWDNNADIFFNIDSLKK